MMHLQINNSTCSLSGLNNEQLSELRAILCYEADPQAAFFSGNHRSTKRYLIDKQGNFPTGLLPYVESWVEKSISKIDAYRRQDCRLSPRHAVSYSIKLPFIPYLAQLDAAAACVERNRGTVAAVTGFGKSVTMALLIQSLGVKTLVVVPNLELKRQLQEVFKQYFGSLEHITIENIDSPALETTSAHGCLIIDEAHHVAAKTYRTLNKKYWNGIYHRYFFTATPFRSRDEERMLFESVAGQVIYRVGYKDAVDNKYIVPIEAYYVDLPKTKEVVGNTWASVYSSLVVHNAARNEIIARLLVRLRSKYISSLCLVKEIAHGNSILKHICRITDDDGIPFAHGKNEYTSAIIQGFNSGVFKAAIGTTGVLGEGVDTKPAEFIIIAGLGKSKNQFMQSVGRGLRVCAGKTSAKIIIFRDKSHKWTSAHFNAQVRILKEEYGVVPAKLDLDL